MLIIKKKLKIGCFCQVGKNSRYFVGVFNKTILALALVGYEMIIANSALRVSLAMYLSYPTCTRGIIVNYIIEIRGREGKIAD